VCARADAHMSITNVATARIDGHIGFAPRSTVPSKHLFAGRTRASSLQRGRRANLIRIEACGMSGTHRFKIRHPQTLV
jgi:hypothetical protein